MHSRVIAREIEHACPVDIFVLPGFFICYVGTFKVYGTENIISKKRSQRAETIFEGGGASLFSLTAMFSDFTAEFTANYK